jgi:hypothetical protein
MYLVVNTVEIKLDLILNWTNLKCFVKMIRTEDFFKIQRIGLKIRSEVPIRKN